jgi:O-antigen/teichoic acid export membrane protein
MAALRALLIKLRSESSFAVMVRVVMMRSLALGLTVLTGMITAAVLGPAGRGEQAAMILAPQFLAGLSSLGLHASLIYKMKTDPAREWEYLGANIVMNTGAAAIMAVAGWLVLPYWLSDFDAATIATARVMLWLTPMLAMSWCFTAAVEVKGWFSFANLVANLQSLLTLATLIVAILLHQLTARSSAYIYMLMNIPTFLVLGGRILTLGMPVLTLRRDIALPLLHYGLRFYGSDLLGTLAATLDQIVVMPLLTPASVGIYVVARSLARMLTTLSDAVASVLFPSVAGLSSTAIVHLVFRTVRVTALVNLVAAVSLGIAAPFLLHLVYGEKFASACTPLRILLGASLFFNAARIVYQAYNASGRPGVVTMIEALATFAGLVLTLLLVPSLGTAGAAWALLFSGAIRLACALGAMPSVLCVTMPGAGFFLGRRLTEHPP